MLKRIRVAIGRLVKRLMAVTQGRISMRLFVTLWGALGVAWACVGDYAAHFLTDYTSEPVFTSLSQELSSFVCTYGGPAVLVWCAAFASSRLFFSNELGGNSLAALRRGTAADRACFSGLTALCIGIGLYALLYLLAGSPAAMLSP